MTRRRVIRNNKEKNPVCYIIFIRIYCKDIYESVNVNIYERNPLRTVSSGYHGAADVLERYGKRL